MSKKIRIIGNVKHDGSILEEYEVYELSDVAADALIASGNAKLVTVDKKASTYMPQAVKVGPDGTRQPGQAVPDVSANENPSAQTVKAVEPAGKKTVKGDDSAN